ncbi:MAG: signal peptidase I [bacterium]
MEKRDSFETSDIGGDFSEADSPLQKGRKPWVAGLLTLCVIGLGQVYNGEFREGIKYYLGSLGLSLFTAFLVLLLPFPMNLLSLALGFLYFMYIFRISWKAAKIKRTYYLLKPYNKTYVYIFLIFLCWYVVNPVFSQFTKDNIVHAYRVVATSMSPTILDGDHILVNEIIYKFARPNRLDVVIFKYPKNESQYFIKRIIGLPGETIQINQKKCYINGKPFQEDYVIHSGNNNLISYPELDNFGPFRIPAGSFFVMGDNRDWSMDSRTFGPVEQKKILGRAFMIYWPGSEGRQTVWRRIGEKIN